MNIADLIVVIVLFAILALIFYATRNSDKNGFSGCHSDCSSCSSFSNLYEEYKKDHHE